MAKKKAKKKLLIIGGNSKIAKQFIFASKNQYELYCTYNCTADVSKQFTAKQYGLNLSDQVSISSFVDSISDIAFDGLILFASTYKADPLNKKEMFKHYQTDMLINAISTFVITKSITFNAGSKVIMLGDNGISLPKRGYASYSLSKLAIDEITKILAIDLAPEVSTICIKLGPTLQDAKSTKKEIYYNRGLVRVDSPVIGLVNLIIFLINESNFNATGCVIIYDGGIYLRRYY